MSGFVVLRKMAENRDFLPAAERQKARGSGVSVERKVYGQDKRSRYMAQTGKRRGRYIQTLVGSGQGGLWEQWRVEERFAAMMESDAMRRAQKGLPMLGLCMLAAQGELAGGIVPFAPALVAAVMMSGGALGWAAAGGMLGAMVVLKPNVLLTCALLYVLQACMKRAEMRANDLACLMVLGLSMGAVPQLYATDAYERLMAGLGAMAAMILAKMMVPALRVRLKERELLCAQEWVGLALVAASALVGLQRVVLYGVRPAYAMLMLLSLSAGYVGGAGAGAAAGGLLGLMMAIAQPAAPFMLSGLVLMGLLSGLFGRMGRGWAAAAAPLAGTLAVAMDAQFLSWGRVVELSAAVTVFLCTKQSAWQWVRSYTSREARLRRETEMTQEAMRTALCGQLEEYASLYGRMARRVGMGGGQYAAVSGALESMAQELGKTVESLPELAVEVARAMDAAGIKVQQVQAFRAGERLGMRLHLACQRRDGLCDGRMLQEASRATGVTLRVKPTGYCPKDGLCTLELEAANRFELSVGYATCAQGDGQPCGDTMTAVQLPQGRYLLALADGMGHGAAAQVESRAAVELMEDFLLARFEPEAALHGVNELLLKKRSGDGFSTMDLMLVDLESGSLRAMKIGAVSSYIRRGRRVICVGGDALPMGIVERVKPSVTQLQLQDGDVLMMVSDGIVDAVGGEEGWLQAELMKADARAPEAASRKIMEAAKAVGRHRDDMTVCVVRVMERGAAAR